MGRGRKIKIGGVMRDFADLRSLKSSEIAAHEGGTKDIDELRWRYKKNGDVEFFSGDPGADDIVFGGSKSDLRRIEELERNMSVLATKVVTASDPDNYDSDDDAFGQVFDDAVRFKNSAVRFSSSAVIFDGSSTIHFGNRKLAAVDDPTADQDAATKAYVDSQVAGGSVQLSGLSDTTITSPSSGQVLKYNGSAWVNDTDTDTDTNQLSGLTDTTISTPSSGQVLKYNGSAWVNHTDTDTNQLSGLTDTTITSPSSGQVLKYNGSAWVNDTDSTGDTVLADGVIQVPRKTATEKDAISSPVNGYMLYNTTDSKLQVYNNGWLTVGNKIPEWSTAEGSLATIFDSLRSSFSGVTVTATDADSNSLTYSVTAGSLPSGLSLNSSTGAITGTPTAVGSDTTSTFSITATDSDGGSSGARQFSITVKAPVVTTYNYTRTVQTWTKPAGITSINAVMWGAGGGGGNPSGQGGAGGGYTYGTIDVSSVSYLHVIVGQLGHGENSHFNDGNGNGNGGGLSGIFTSFDSDRSATHGRSVLIAGGGGGGGNNGGYPGTGGGSSGVAGSGGQGGGAGTQSAGGSTASSGGSCTSNCTAQKLRGANGCGGSERDSGSSWPSTYWGGIWSAGAGGNGCNAGGGGGGYYGGGGGGGSPNGGQGGGGSGYIGGHSNAPVSNASTSSNGNNQAPAGTGHTHYPGSSIGYGASGAEVNGNNGAVVIWY